jgi:hypothetical protein
VVSLAFTWFDVLFPVLNYLGLCGIEKLREVSHDALRLQERYHRVDIDTIEFNLKVDDPKVFVKTWDADTRILKRKSNAEIQNSARTRPPRVLPCCSLARSN